MSIIKDDADIVDRDRIDELAKLPKLDYDRLRKDAAKELGIRTFILDGLVKARRKATGPKPTLPADVDALERSAAAIIRCKDILGLFADAFSKTIAGEQRNGKLLYVIATSRLLDRTMHAVIKGTSAGGKSELRKSVLEFIPPESVISLTSLSEKALIHYADDFAHKILSMGEALATEEQTFQDYLLRELMSEGRIRHLTVQKSGNDLVSMTVEKEGPVSFMVTTTKNKLHPENETRMLSLEIDDSEGQTRAVLRKVAQVEGLNQTGSQINYEPWRDYQRWLEAGERRVVVPFADDTAQMIPAESVRLRRDWGQVIRAIKVHALLHRAHRERDKGGQIVADVETDYRIVRDLMNDALAEGSGVSVKAAMAETVDAVRRLAAKCDADQGVSAQAVGKELKLDKSSARRRLQDAQHAELVVNLEQRRGRPGQYRATDQRVNSKVMLPSVDELEQVLARPFTPNPMPPCHHAQDTGCFQADNGGRPGGTGGAGGDPDRTVAAMLATVKPLKPNGDTPPVAGWHANSDAPACDHCRQPGTGDNPLLEVSTGSQAARLHDGCIRPFADLEIPPFLRRAQAG